MRLPQRVAVGILLAFPFTNERGNAGPQESRSRVS